MATILLQAVGGLIGGALGSTGAAIGTAAGALAGYALDRALINSTKHVEGPRLTGARPYSAEEGASLPRVYGTVRIGGVMIWATRFEEDSRTERQGGKGGPRTTAYSYYANVAFALCEGEVSGIRRVWADGQELDLTGVEMRLYRGGETQPADPLIEAKQGVGNTPAYRGTAYVVFDRMPLEAFGNRIPQLQFEVMRPIGGLNGRVKAVALIPGSTEYGLSPHLVTRTLSPGEVVAENRNVLHASTDIVAALDELQALCPNLEHIALVVTWFGDDLRAGHCSVRPKVTHNDAEGLSQPWIVSGLDRASARQVSFHEGGAAFGGTPSDRSVTDAMAEIKARGIAVTLYPFVMMDVPADNALPNPYGGVGQPAYPWRGRTTCDPAPAEPGSADKSGAARSQIEAFRGNAEAGDFAPAGDTILFAGGDDWGYRRLVLHYAHLAAAAGGIDAFLLGSELRGLTTLRDETGAFPFVDTLCELAGEARGILGGATRITYGADWTEYSGYQPADGSGDVYFHLDPFWSHADVDAVGIDCYMPLADWRDEDHANGNPDGAAGPYDLNRMRQAVAGGEGYDWYYASDADRLDRIRTPVADGMHGKPWVFRNKDLVNWWSNQHFDRPGGVETGSPTGWAPQSKPIWLTELGCPAVDKGPNQPNVFPDPKSSESASPYFSSGARSDVAQLNFLRTHLDHWDGSAPDFDGAENPLSTQYSGRMLDASRIYLWAWDARPFPAFPIRKELWGDCDNWLLGHWLNGRLSNVSTAELAERIIDDFGAGPVRLDDIGGSVGGYLVADPTTARRALEPVADLFGLSCRADGEGLHLAGEGARPDAAVSIEDFAVADDGRILTRLRQPDHEFPAETVIAFTDPLNEYQSATARRLHPDAPHGGQDHSVFPGALDPAQAEALIADRTRRRWLGREELHFSLPQTRIDITPGSLIRVADDGGQSDYLVTDCDAGLRREYRAKRLRRVAPAPWRAHVAGQRRNKVVRAGPPLGLFLDLPLAPGDTAPQDGLRIALRAKPWTSHAAYNSPEESGFERRNLVPAQATIGRLQNALAPGFQGRFDRATTIVVVLYDGELASASDLHLLNGANAAAVQCLNSEWEILQFADAQEIAPATWRLSRLLRGQNGTGAAMTLGAAQGAHFVLLDDAVKPAGLRPTEVGLSLNWRIGPVGAAFGGPAFAGQQVNGGERALRPLAPVHLRMKRTPDGGCRFSWVRRSRLAGDTKLSGDVPLGEDIESYLVSVSAPGEPSARSANAGETGWTYGSTDMGADFGSPPAELELTVRQISAAVGPGDAASRVFSVG